MMYARWGLSFLINAAVTLAALVAMPFLSLFTAGGWPSWGSWFWTYDNPPQGDGGYQRERAPYTPAGTPWELYVNRVMWLYRNPMYGLAKLLAVEFLPGNSALWILHSGGEGVDTSDKYRKAGWYYAECRDNAERPRAFELYVVWPWSERRCLRVRLGYKIVTDKFSTIGFAPFVNVVNPVKSYG